MQRHSREKVTDPTGSHDFWVYRARILTESPGTLLLNGSRELRRCINILHFFHLIFCEVKKISSNIYLTILCYEDQGFINGLVTFITY